MGTTKTRIDGAANKGVGAVKEAAGKVTGDKSLELSGKAQKAKGDVQAAVGKAGDKVKKAMKS